MNEFRLGRPLPRRQEPSRPARKTHARPKSRPDGWLIEAVVLIHEITAVADRIAAARDFDGTHVAAADTQSRMLRALGRSSRRLSMSDVARRLCISRQAARNVIIAASNSGLLDLDTNPHDRRVIQVELTARARAELRVAQVREKSWALELLNGLDVRTMRGTSHILRVIRQRLVRNERTRARRPARK